MSKNSIVYKYLKSLGTVIYSIQDDLTRDFVASKMYECDIYKNRGIITVNYSSKSINSKIEAILHLWNDTSSRSLFVYNRPFHTRKVIEALQLMNILYKQI